MLDPGGLFTTEAEFPDLHSPVLLHVLPGFVDAGAAGRLVADQLLSSLDHELLVTFDVDQLIDHRCRRPAMTFVEDHFESYTPHLLALHLLRDESGQQFLLLTGPEPDIQWERFVAAVGALVDLLGVRLSVGVNSIPMAVPHTRPTGLTAHATNTSLITGYEPWIGTVTVPGSVAALLELRLGETGHDAVGFAVHVPHYLAQTEYPDAAETLLDAIASATGLILPRAALQAAGVKTREHIDEQLARSEEVIAVVQALEQQYDANAGVHGRPPLLTVESAELPTADELGAELERFLAEQNRDS